MLIALPIVLLACGGDEAATDEPAAASEEPTAATEEPGAPEDEEAEPDAAEPSRPGYTSTSSADWDMGPRAVVQCSAGVPPGTGSPISPQWVAYSDRDHATLDPMPPNCQVGESDILLRKVIMSEDETGRAKCGVGMQGAVSTSYKFGYAGASAAVIQKTLQNFSSIDLQTRGDGKLYRLEMLMDDQLDMQCGDEGLNPYGVVFRCGNGNDSAVVAHKIELDGLSQELAEGGKAWGDALPWDASEVRRVQIRPVNSGGNDFAFDCKFRLNWIEPRAGGGE